MEPTPALGPQSELGRLMLDWRYLLNGFAAGILQLMHPAIGAAVKEQSDFFEDPWQRIMRSVPRIVASVVADDSERRALNVRDYHRDVKGVDHHGTPYHAMEPATFWWAHATFTWAALHESDTFHHRPIQGERRTQLYAESVEWYRRYGLSMRPVPESLAAFDNRFAVICAEELELTPAAERAIQIALGEVMTVPFVPPAIGAALGISALPLVRLTAIGSMPAVVRERFDIPWSRADAAGYSTLVTAARGAGRVLPERLAAQAMTRLLKQAGSSTYLTMPERH